MYGARWIEEIDGELAECEGLLAQGGGVIVAEPGDLEASGHADVELTSRVLDTWRQAANSPRAPAATSCRLP